MNDSKYSRAHMESEIFEVDVVKLDIEGLSEKELKSTVKSNSAANYLVTQCEANDNKKINLLETMGFRVAGFPAVLTVNLHNFSNKFEKKIKEKKAIYTGFGMSKEKITIRPYVKTDLEEIKKIARGAFKSAHWYSTNVSMKKIDDFYVKWAENSCKGRAVIVLVAEQKGKVLGFNAVNLSNDKKSAQIDLIAVAPEARGKGIGKFLVAESLDWAKSNKLEEMKVKTEVINYPAINIYLGQGFKLVWLGVNMNKENNL